MTPELTATLQTLLLWTLPPLAVALVTWAVKSAAGAYAEWKLAQPDKAGILEQAAAMVVKAAEQNGLTGKLAELGQSKKEWAIEQLENVLAGYGVKLDVHALDAAIEAAVLELFPHDPAA